MKRLAMACALAALMMAASAGAADAQIELADGGARITGTGAAFAQGVLNITEPGTYTISGALDGQISVYAGKNGAVTLELAGADIYNENGQAIEVTKTGTLTVSLADGTQNRLQSGAAMPETIDEDAESVECLSTKDDLVITGDGALTVLGYLGCGIKASNNLTIESGSIDVTAARIGIKGKDSVTIAGGEVAIASGRDGIQADADDGECYGVVNLTGGVLRITSGGDAVQAETQLNVTGGEIIAVTGGGSANATGEHENDDFMNFSGGRFGGERMERGDRMRRGTATDGEASEDFFDPRNENMKPDAGGFGPGDGQNTGDFAQGMTPPDGDFDPTAGEMSGDMTLPDGDFDPTAGDMMPDDMTPPEGGFDPTAGEMPGDMTPPDGDFDPTAGDMMPDDMTPPDGGFNPTAGEMPGDMTPPEGGFDPMTGDAQNDMTPPDGDFDPTAGEMPGDMTPPDDVSGNGEDGTAFADMPDAVEIGGTEQSAKGLKSNGAMTISGGSITIDAQDDALHAAGDIIIGGGVLTLKSGDDGVHSDAVLTISGGDVTVAESYEGLEGWSIVITGGDVRVTADDDGLNASGDGGDMGFGRWRMQSEESDMELCELWISGGTLTVDAQGDGIDSNGDLYIEGGVVIVNGPTNSGNGAIDSGSESGGACSVSGGTVLALGAVGMAEGFDQSSAQASFMLTLGQTLRAGGVLRILDESGNVLIEHTAVKDAQSVVFSCPALAVGQTVTVEAGGASQSVTLDSIASNGRAGGGSGRGRRR